MLVMFCSAIESKIWVRVCFKVCEFGSYFLVY